MTKPQPKKYIRKRDASTRAKHRAQDRAKAERIYDYRRKWDPEAKARAEAEATYRQEQKIHRVFDRLPRVPRKTGRGQYGYESWSLGKANVGRDKRTGRFIKRKVGR